MLNLMGKRRGHYIQVRPCIWSNILRIPSKVAHATIARSCPDFQYLIRPSPEHPLHTPLTQKAQSASHNPPQMPKLLWLSTSSGLSQSCSFPSFLSSLQLRPGSSLIVQLPPERETHPLLISLGLGAHHQPHFSQASSLPAAALCLLPLPPLKSPPPCVSAGGNHLNRCMFWLSGFR